MSLLGGRAAGNVTWGAAWISAAPAARAREITMSLLAFPGRVGDSFTLMSILCPCAFETAGSYNYSQVYFKPMILTAVLLAFLFVASSASSQQTSPDFAREVQPILNARCAGCHAGKTPQAGLGLHTRAEMLKG